MPGGYLQYSNSTITTGFSGGPVLDETHRRWLGIVSLADESMGVGMIVPAELIERVCPDLLVENDGGEYRVLTAGLGVLGGTLAAGVEDFLAQYLGTSTERVPFGGRDVQLRALDDWLGDLDAARAAIIEPAGRGKSALSSHWAMQVAASGRARVAFVPISIRFETAQL
jgi:hypothetical protein